MLFNGSMRDLGSCGVSSNLAIPTNFIRLVSVRASNTWVFEAHIAGSQSAPATTYAEFV